MEKVNRDARTGDKDSQKLHAVLNQIKEGLEQAKNVRQIEFTEKEREEVVHGLQLLTDKPVLYVCNVAEGDAASGNDLVNKVTAIADGENAEVLTLAVSIEADINELETFEERQILEDLGLSAPGC